MRGETQYSKKTIKPEQLATEIRNITEQYGLDGVQAVLLATKKTSTLTAKATNTSAKSMIKGRRHKYEKSWKSKTTPTRFGAEGVVYSTQPGLAHLLEHGHVIVYLGGNKSKGSGWSPAKPHIEPVDKAVPELFAKEIQKEFEKL